MGTRPRLHYLSSCFLIILTAYLLPLSSSLPSTGFVVELMHADAHMNLTYQQHVHAGIRRSHHRAVHHSRHVKGDASPLHMQATTIEKPLKASQAEYVMMLTIGTPPATVPVIFDTGSTLIWTLCYQPPNTTYPTFNPQNSSSYSKVPCASPVCNISSAFSKCKGVDCNYLAMYAEPSYCTGLLGWETLTFGSMKIKNVGFGCTTWVSNFPGYGSGIVGFNRGALSLISQLGPIVDHQFSYCLAGFNESKRSMLILGPSSHSVSSNNATISVPLVENPAYPEQYFVALQGISVGGKRLPIAEKVFQIHSDASGGFIVDSGSTVTGLVQEAYSILREEFIKQTGKSVSSAHLELDTCFHGLPHSIPIPALTFHFEGGDLHVPFENYILVDPKDNLSCLAILPSPVDISIIGATTLQNFFVHFELGRGVVSFTPAQCSTL